MNREQANNEVMAALESPIEKLMLYGIVFAASQREWRTNVFAPCPRCNPEKRLDFSDRAPERDCGECLGGYVANSYIASPHRGDLGCVTIWLQRIAGRYRVDMVVEVTTCDLSAPEGGCVYRCSPAFAVECDGRDYHSTPEQVAHDKVRDREILTAYGWPTLRFTGSELNRASKRISSALSSKPLYGSVRCGDAVLRAVTARWASETKLDSVVRNPFDDGFVTRGPSPGGSLSEGRPEPAAGAAVQDDAEDDGDWPTRCRVPGCPREPMSTATQCWPTCEFHSSEMEHEIRASTATWEEITPLPAPPRSK